MKLERVYLRAPVQEMAAAEVQALIGEDRYRAIKAKDPHPLFVALSAGHEGESRGRILGRSQAEPGNRKRWSRNRIRELALRLAQAPVYLFHNADNSPRKPIGEIVAALARRIQGRLHALGVAYIEDPEARERIRSGELDTCSIEAELLFSRRGKGESWLVEAVRQVTGLALGSRAVASPGFAGANLLAVVQEFEPVAAENEKSIRRLEDQLKNREQRIRKLESELERLQQPAEPTRVSEQITRMVETRLGGCNLSREEAALVLDRVREFTGPRPRGAADLSRLVEERVQKELDSLDRLRRIYTESNGFPTPPEPEKSGGDGSEPWKHNPLIPKED